MLLSSLEEAPLEGFASLEGVKELVKRKAHILKHSQDDLVSEKSLRSCRPCVPQRERRDRVGMCVRFYL